MRLTLELLELSTLLTIRDMDEVVERRVELALRHWSFEPGFHHLFSTTEFVCELSRRAEDRTRKSDDTVKRRLLGLEEVPKRAFGHDFAR